MTHLTARRREIVALALAAPLIAALIARTQTFDPHAWLREWFALGNSAWVRKGKLNLGLVTYRQPLFYEPLSEDALYRSRRMSEVLNKSGRNRDWVRDALLEVQGQSMREGRGALS